MTHSLGIKQSLYISICRNKQINEIRKEGEGMKKIIIFVQDNIVPIISGISGGLIGAVIVKLLDIR